MEPRNTIPNWMISARCYLFGLLPFFIRLTSEILHFLGLVNNSQHHDIAFISTLHLASLVVIRISISKPKFGIAWRAFLLGCLLNCGLILAAYSTDLQSFGMFCVAMSFFHWSEYMTQSVFNPETTDVDSYMLYHSHAYVASFVICLIEYAAELYFYPQMKTCNVISNIGLTLVIGGESLRKVSMFTAKSNFNHYVQDRKDERHELVTHGVYALFRHPAYVGWYWWSVGTQILLCNPVCIVLFAAASWKFFSDRIYWEEKALIRFFGDDYLEYQKEVGTGIPFIKGYSKPWFPTEEKSD